MNCVLDNNLDIISGTNHSNSDVEHFKEVLTMCDLTDTWRMFHRNEKEFTWCRKPLFIAHRLDYILVTDTVFNHVSECNILTVAHSDHRAVDLQHKISKVKRGPSYWKFNDNLLHDINFVD